MKTLLVIWFFVQGAGYPTTTKMDNLAECERAKAALVKAFPREESMFAASTGIREKTVYCVEY